MGFCDWLEPLMELGGLIFAKEEVFSQNSVLLHWVVWVHACLIVPQGLFPIFLFSARYGQCFPAHRSSTLNLIWLYGFHYWRGGIDYSLHPLLLMIIPLTISSLAIFSPPRNPLPAVRFDARSSPPHHHLNIGGDQNVPTREIGALVLHLTYLIRCLRINLVILSSSNCWLFLSCIWIYQIIFIKHIKADLIHRHFIHYCLWQICMSACIK